MSTQSNPLYDALCKRLIARIIETPANCDPPTDIDLRLAAIIGERDDLARRNAELEKAAKAVVWFDWSDNDEDAVAAIAELRALAAGGER